MALRVRYEGSCLTYLTYIDDAPSNTNQVYFVKLFKSGVFMKRSMYGKLSAEAGMFSRG